MHSSKPCSQPTPPRSLACTNCGCTGPRTLRIFQLGNAIEAELARFLRQVPGVELHTESGDGSQFGFRYLGEHFAGSMDSAILGVPEAPKTWHVWESKSVSHKRFADLVKKGVKEWSPEYYAQLQCYMGASGMDRALFMAYDKDDSSIHVERVHREPMFWEGMLAKAERIITTYDAPASSFKDRTWFEAKFMSEDAQAIYWGDRLPRPNCRNCRFCEADLEDEAAVWHCHWWKDDRDLVQQFNGCDDHQFLTCFMSEIADPVESNQPLAMYRHKTTGKLFANGLGDHGADYACYSSAELAALVDPKAFVTDTFVDGVKATFHGSKIVTTGEVPF